MHFQSVVILSIGLVFCQSDVPDTKVRIGFDLGKDLYMTSSTLDEARGDKWMPGDDVPIGINPIVSKATDKLRSLVTDTDKWKCFEIALTRHDVSNLWYWTVVFYDNSPESVESRDPEIIVIGVHLDGRAFDVANSPLKKPVCCSDRGLSSQRELGDGIFQMGV